MQKIKNEKGITLVILIITIIVIALISIPTTLRISDIIKMNEIAKYKDDFTTLQETIEQVVPQDVAISTSNVGPLYGNSFNSYDKNINDGNQYYIISVNILNQQLEAKTGTSMAQLNFGEGNYSTGTNTDDVYIINGQSRTIYYVKGFFNSNNNIQYSSSGWESYTNIVVQNYFQ